MSALMAGGFHRRRRAANLPVVLFVTAALCLLLLGFGFPATARASGSGLTKEQEKLCRVIEGKLIAPCCWTQPVAVHQSDAAEQIKAEVATLVSQGKGESEVIEVFVGRYGEKILAAPRPRGLNLAAYLAPILAVLVGAAAMLVLVGRWRRGRPSLAGPSAQAGIDPEVTEWEERLTEELSRFDR